MSNRIDRRGDRRREQWTCQDSDCYRHDTRAELEHDGTVYCTACGTVDRRGTEGNRRRAAQELRRLEERIERDMGHVLERVENIEARAHHAGNERAQLGADVQEVARAAREARDDAADAQRTADAAKAAADDGRSW